MHWLRVGRPGFSSCPLYLQCDWGQCLCLSGRPSSHVCRDVWTAVPCNAGLESGGWFPPPSGMRSQPRPMGLRGGESCKEWESKIVKQLDGLTTVILSESGTWNLRFPRQGSSVQQHILHSCVKWCTSKTSGPLLGLWMTGVDRLLFP